MPALAPLSFQQQWLWNLARQYPEWNCVLSYAYRLSGSLDLEQLRNGIDVVFNRHDSLRTKIVLAERGVALDVDDPLARRFEIVEVEGSAQQAVQEFCSQQLDPADAPLRLRLFRISATEHFLALAVHRVVADCHSIDQVFDELWACYRGETASGSTPMQYSAYTTRQRDNQPAWQRRHAKYWAERLRNAQPAQWPHDAVSSSATPSALGDIKATLGAQLSNELKDAARRCRTLTANVMLALYVAAIAKWCKQTDFIVPFNMAGRQTEHRHVVGYFSHILFLRMTLTGRETYLELLSLVSNELFRAMSHQDFGIMATERADLLRGVYFQWLSWQAEAVAVPGPESAALTKERVTIRDFGAGLTAVPAGMVDVELTFFDAPDAIQIRGVYPANRFSPATMERFVDGLLTTCRTFVRAPDARVFEETAYTA